jgi:PAS domain S-box-containing protein
MVDMSGRIIEWNQLYLDLIGYSAEEVGRLTYVQITPERWRTEEARLVAEEILPKGVSPVCEQEYIRKDGRVIPVELRTFLITDAAGQLSAMWAIPGNLGVLGRLLNMYYHLLATPTRERALQVAACSPKPTPDVLTAFLASFDEFVQAAQRYQEQDGHD